MSLHFPSLGRRVPSPALGTLQSKAHRCIIRWVLRLLLVLLPLSLARAQTIDRSPDYDAYDVRTWSAPRPEPAGSPLSASSSAQPAPALYDLAGPLTPPRGDDPESIAREFLRDRVGSLRPNAIQTIDLALAARSESTTAGLIHLVFRPEHLGIPYFEADVQVHLDNDGRIWRVDQTHVPTPPAGLSTAVTAQRAVQVALQILAGIDEGGLRTVEPPSGATQRTVFEHPELPDPIPAALVWFPLAEQSVPAWQLYVYLDAQRAYLVVVRAGREEILFSRNLSREVDPIGRVFRAPDRAHPDEGEQTDEPFTGWPAADGFCPADIYPAQFRSGSEANRCWVEAAQTKGNNADACLDLDADNLCDGRAEDSGAQFLFTFTDDYSSTGNPATDRSAALTNAFYWTNVLHDWLYGLGFDEASGNFQEDNYGRDGAGGDAVRVDVQDGSLSNNANIIVPPDGIAPRMQLGLFTSLRRDSAFDADVITHEYIHGLTTRLIGGPLSVTGLFRWHSGALSEGWSDAYAVSFTNHPVIGEYSSRNPSTGIRSVAYNSSSHTFGRFGTLFRKAVPGTSLLLDLPQVHRDGEIWATLLWDLRHAIGETAFENIATTGLRLTPNRPSMLDARDAIIQAALTLGVGGGNACGVWQVFAARGFGASAALNPKQVEQPNDTALSVYEAFDLPEICGDEPLLPVDARFDDDVEGGENGWTATGLWHRTNRRAASGVFSWWFGQEATGNYDTGARVFGSLTSPVIDLSGVGSAIVEWDQILRTEGFGEAVNLGSGSAAPYLNADEGRLLISIAGGPWITLTHLAHNNSSSSFEHHKINISRYTGQTIRLRFEIDTIDGVDNHFEGWFIDNVRVSRLSSTASELVVDPTSLDFTAAAGQGAPLPQTLSISNGSGGALGWTAGVTQGNSWLSVSATSGVAPSDVSVAVDPSGLAAGVYTGAVEIEAPEASGSPATVNVSLTITAPGGPVAAWPFEEAGSGPGVTIADATGGHHGATRGFGSVPMLGASGAGRLFNGSTDYVEVPPSSALTPETFTFRTWVKVLTYPEKFGIILSAFGGSNFEGWYLAVKSSGEVLFMGAQPPDKAPWLVSQRKLDLHHWHFISVTVDRISGDVALYIDGQPDVKTRFSGIEADASVPLTMGRASWYDGYYLNFAIDETEIYPALRTATEIASDFQQFAPPPPPANLTTVAEWSFEDGAQDVSGNGHTGGLNGTQTSPGVTGNARRFNGASDSVTVSSSPDLTPASFTVRAWVKLRSPPADWGAIVANYGGQFDGWYIGVDSDGRVLFSAGSLPSSLRTATSQSRLTLNRWRHLAATYDGGTRTVTLYLDGVMAGQAYLAGLTPQAGGFLAMGKASWTNEHFLEMDLDEVRIDPGVWTASEVQADFASFNLDQAVEPVAIWKFDDSGSGPGTVLADSSGNGHDATTQGLGTESVPGVVGAARSFAGRPDYAWLARHEDLNSASFTFAAWVRLDRLPDNWGVIFSTYGGDYRGWYAGVLNDGRMIFSVSGLPSSNPWLLSNSSLQPGQWHYLTVTLEGASRRGRIYIDGALDRTAVFPAFTPQTAVQPTIGKASWVDSYYLSCVLDEARLYPAELTGDEVTALFQSFPAPPASQAPEPVAHWRFDETEVGAGTLLADSTGNEHDAVTAGGSVPARGIAGSARSFGGFPDYAWLSPDADFGSADFSFTAWVKIDALPEKWGVIFSNYGGDFLGWYAGLFTDGRVIFSVSGLPSSNPWLLSTTALVPGRWHHVAVTLDASSRAGRIYIDGLLDRTAVFPAWDSQSSVQPMFGRASWVDSYYLQFFIDEARLYAEELSATQVLLDRQSSE